MYFNITSLKIEPTSRLLASILHTFCVKKHYMASTYSCLNIEDNLLLPVKKMLFSVS